MELSTALWVARRETGRCLEPVTKKSSRSPELHVVRVLEEEVSPYPNISYDTHQDFF